MAIGACKKISLRLDAELVDGLQAFADQERVPVSFILRHLVIRFLSPSPPAVPLFRAEGGAAEGGKGRFSSEGSDARRNAQNERAEREKAEFDRQVFTIFDAFRDQGMDVKEAAKRTNFVLKERKHPWATYEVVAGVLRSSGRFRKLRRR